MDNNQLLFLRSKIIQAIRQYFIQQEYLEVDTPYLVKHPGLEYHIEAFPIVKNSEERLYLHTSPEFSMKKILSKDFPKIFQIAKVFRDKENTPYHQREFLMLEWYRIQADYMDLMDDIHNLITFIGETVFQSTSFYYKNQTLPLHHPPKRFSLVDLFQSYLDIDFRTIKEAQTLYDALKSKSMEFPPDLDLENLFYFIIMDIIEPALKKHPHYFLYDYPKPCRILARLKKDDPMVAQRFEYYLTGVEIANGWSEIINASELETVLKEARAQRIQNGLNDYGIDRELIAKFNTAFPPYAGVALGIDRLIMVLTNQSSIRTIQFLKESS